MLNSIPSQVNSFFRTSFFNRPFSEISQKNKLIALVATAIIATFALLIYLKRSHRKVSHQPSPAKPSPILNQPVKLNQFQAKKDEFSKWISKAAQDYPGQYGTNGVAMVLELFDSLPSENEFNKGIDHLKDVDKVIRGKAAYYIKKEMKRLIFDHLGDPLDIAKLGLKVEESHATFPVIDDKTRFGTRDEVIEEICRHIKMDPKQFHSKITPFVQKINGLEDIFDTGFKWLKDYLQEVILFTPAGDRKKYMTKDTQILGRFDVLAVPSIMDYNGNWKKQGFETQTPFYLHHGAALNVGESAKAEDYADYSFKDGTFDKTKYLKDMGKIFHQMLAAQQASGVEHAVCFPFGMGAFLRNLPKMDSSYNREELAILRQEIAEAFVKEVNNFPELQIYMCLPLDDKKGSDTQQNYNAFVHAFSEAPSKTKDRVGFYVNVDATDLAQRLANKYRVPYKVSMANGANRNLIGNRWFDGECRTAIDENAHRRAVLAAFIALLLNCGIEYTKRNPEDLGLRVEQFGGKHKTI
jgi:hypothetical protein